MDCGYLMAVQASSGIAAIAARMLEFTGAVTENRAPRERIAPGGADRCTARLAAPRAEAAFPPRSLVAPITGAAIGVLMTAVSAFRPRTGSGFPWILVWPNFTPCLACP